MILQLEDCQLVFFDTVGDYFFELENTQNALKTASCLSQVAQLLKVPTLGVSDRAESGRQKGREMLKQCAQVISSDAFDVSQEGVVQWLRGNSLAKIPNSGNARSLPKHLQKKEPETLPMTVLLMGWETHITLLQTSLSLVEEGFDVCLVSDASAAAHGANHDAALDRLAAAGVELLSAEMVVYEWLSSRVHPLFEQARRILQTIHA